MIRNYFLIASRYLLRNKGYTAINLAGLAIGISCCILIMLFVRSEFSYDRFHAKSDRLYRAWLQEVYEGQTFTNTQTPIPLGPALNANIPEIINYCRVNSFNTLVQYQGNKFNEPVTMVDTSFFRLFDFKLTEGNLYSVFPNANSLVISERMANKYFGKTAAIGKSLELQLSAEKVLFTVTAVAGKVVQESSIQFDFLIPHSNDHYLYSEAARTRGWTSVFEETYVLLEEGKTGKDAESKIPSWVKQIAGDEYVAGQYNVYLQPITDIHLNKELPAGNQPISDPVYAYILGVIGILILLIACINFVTLSIGRSSSRSLEVGVRKVLGAVRSQLISQFWGEALLMTFVSMVLAIGMAYFLLQPFNQLANRELALSWDAFTVSFLLLLMVVIGLISGMYPALVLASFIPVKVLKSRIQDGISIGLFRKGLMTVQFVASIVMIIGTLVMWQQMRFVQHTNLGYDHEHIVVIPTNKPRKDGKVLAERYKSELIKNPQIQSLTTSLFSFSEPGWVNLGYEDDQKVYRNFRMNAVDADFVPAMKLEIIQGRNFASDNAADITNSMIVNEKLVKEYGWSDPIGKKLPGRYSQQIIGVVKDFNYESLHSPVQPLVLVMQPDSMMRSSNDIGFSFAPQPRISVRVNPGNLQDQIALLESAWKNVAGDQEFEYQFLDESLQNLYQNEQRISSIVQLASILSIFIASMGLFGLITLTVNRRLKEIGIRKVLGADIKSIVLLLSKDFILLVILASVIAFPLSWWALNKWLNDFTYRVELSLWVFLLGGVTALIIALFTVSFQAFRAAATNPVRSLRTE